MTSRIGFWGERWHFLADDFTNYFRMMVVHLGVRGWQQAFTPVGLSPNTEQVCDPFFRRFLSQRCPQANMVVKKVLQGGCSLLEAFR